MQGRVMNDHEHDSRLTFDGVARTYLSEELLPDADLTSLSKAQRVEFERDVARLAEVLRQEADRYWLIEEAERPTIFESFAGETVHAWRGEDPASLERDSDPAVIGREAARLALRLEDAAAYFLGCG